jgi:hypothetical protein
MPYVDAHGLAPDEFMPPFGSQQPTAKRLLAIGLFLISATPLLFQAVLRVTSAVDWPVTERD